MRETFPREAAGSPEPFTGERLTASIHGQVEIEHLHRYLVLRGFCRDRDVLDVACGEGYGAAQLAQVANRVVGLDVSGPTVRNAATSFPRSNLRFVQGDVRSLPLKDASVDVVTSFETENTLPGAPCLIAIASESVPRLAPVCLLIERSELDNFRLADYEAELNRLKQSEALAQETAEADRKTARAAVEAARRTAEQSEADTNAAAVTLTHTRAALVQANTDLERISGSLILFLIQYVARLWRRMSR